MSKKVTILIAIIYLTCSATYILAQDNHNHDRDHDKHETYNNQSDRSDHAEHESHDEATHQDHDNHDDGTDIHDHDDHEDELSIQLTSEGIRLAGIEISKTILKRVAKSIELPGEIGFNEDRLAHISPRFAGIALKANYRVGDYVNKGEAVAIIESNESMNSYSIKAPISGWVIERHITQGEFVSEENSIYVIADLSTVWANLAVYPKDAPRVKKGQVATIRAIGTENVITGSIEFVTPIMDFNTRSATARIVLPNPDNAWCPGSFVHASIVNENEIESLVVEKNAVQFLDDQSVVFITDGQNRFKPVDVKTGDSDSKYIQILEGLNENSEYVSSGAFELKAKIVTSNLDAHAGHGH
jgi:cobalt-zinc-cadmium efflux system membrane fusion protein